MYELIFDNIKHDFGKIWRLRLHQCSRSAVQSSWCWQSDIHTVPITLGWMHTSGQSASFPFLFIRKEFILYTPKSLHSVNQKSINQNDQEIPFSSLSLLHTNVDAPWPAVTLQGSLDSLLEITKSPFQCYRKKKSSVQPHRWEGNHHQCFAARVRGDYIDSGSREIAEGAKTRDHTSAVYLCVLIS